jgi:hypothetical protein
MLSTEVHNGNIGDNIPSSHARVDENYFLANPVYKLMLGDYGKMQNVYIIYRSSLPKMMPRQVQPKFY